MRFLRSQIKSGIIPEMFSSGRLIPVTVPPTEQLISVQLHGEEVEFHDCSVSGLPHCSLSLSRTVLSATDACEFTKRGREIKRKERRRSGVLLNVKSSSVI